MATCLLHASKPLPKRWLNRVSILIYTLALALLLFRHSLNLISSPSPISTALFFADLILAFMWFTCQAFHLNPIDRQVFPVNLRQAAAERDFPAVDVFICTADPLKEPPVGVVNTALSVMAYEYPAEKLSVYVSDDGGSKLTLYALMEAGKFARYWLPYCRKHDIVDRSPEVYFGHHPACFTDTHEVKVMYESMKSRIEMAVESGGRFLGDGAFHNWISGFTTRNHPPIIQIIVDNNTDKDVGGSAMPNLIYVSREKSKDRPHNFKAGALNVLIRVSETITGAPLVLVLDCDMYSNNPQTPLHALCYFLDPNVDSKLGFVQFPQRFHGLNKNDIYASEFKPETQILSLGMDGLLGAQFMGTGGFFRRHVLSGCLSNQINSKPRDNKLIQCEDVLVSAHQVARCDYEDNTKWGVEIGFRYGTLTEDTYTSFRLHCEGWKSVLCNPKRAAFLGGAPSTMNDALTQTKRWYMGFLDIIFSKYSPITYGIRSMNPLQALCYTHYTLRAFWSIPVIIYAFVPQLSLINSFPIFPKVSEVGFLLYAFLFLGVYVKDFLDFVVFAGGSTQRWWNHERMWMIWGLSSYPFALLEWSLKSLGVSTFGFNVTSKVVEEEQSKRYEQGVFEFGVVSPLFFLVSVASMINLFGFLKGVVEVFKNGSFFEEFFVQICIAGFAVVNSWPIYEAMVIRSDHGKMPLKLTLASMATSLAIYLASSLAF